MMAGGMGPNRMAKNINSQSMPELPPMNQASELTAITEAAASQETDVNYNHYVNNQNQKVNTMTINRNNSTSNSDNHNDQGNNQGGGNLRPETSGF